jgi:hypothetical protein
MLKDQTGGNAAANKVACGGLSTKAILIIALVSGSIAVGLGVGLGIGLSSQVFIPLVKPPVDAATPPAFIATSGRLLHQGRELQINTQSIRDRFFSNGPTNIQTILASVDDRLKSINSRSQGHSCMVATPVPYTINAFGESFSMKASCVQQYSTPSPGVTGFTQWYVDNQTANLWDFSGEVGLAAIITIDPSGNSTLNTVKIWLSVGRSNICGSHAVVMIYASKGILEMSVAGQGIGFCGAQFRSDSSAMYIIGSPDGGSSCTSTDTACVLPTDGTTNTTCSDSLKTFVLRAVGRTAYSWTAEHCADSRPLNGAGAQSYGASLYPGGASNQVNCDGTA